MPLIVKWPSVVKTGSESNQLVISNDFFPTFTAIAGLEDGAAKHDGKNFLSNLKDPSSPSEPRSLFWHYPHYHKNSLGPQGAMRKGNYKLIEWFEKSSKGEPGAFELYNLASDPKESRNLATSHPKLLKEMKGQLIKWRSSVGAQVMPKNPKHMP